MTIFSAETYSTDPDVRALITAPSREPSSRSIPVPTSGASQLINGTACRCIFDPIKARLASSCSRNGINAVGTEKICFGDASR
jgi:hypothetical protein